MIPFKFILTYIFLKQRSTLNSLELGYILPEELLRVKGFELGILGLPRDDFDSMLMPKIKEADEQMSDKVSYINLLKHKILLSTVEYFFKSIRKIMN